MSMSTEKQLSVPQKKSALQPVLSVMIFILSLFIVVCLFLTAYIMMTGEPAEPKLLVLNHPSDPMVPAGVTREDLKKAMDLSKDWTKSYLRGAFSGAAQGDFTQGLQDSLEDIYSIEQLLSAGRIVSIPNDTRCTLIDSGLSLCQVQITEGPYGGSRYWVYRKCLSRIRDGEMSGGAFFGFMCASVYIRYFITALICCLGIYTLKLKSMGIQFLLFVFGMLLLNLLWARIAMLLMF